MAKSIIQAKTGPIDRECLLCRMEADRKGYHGELRHTGLHKHHLIHGRYGAFRKKAEHYGLWAYMCHERHHEHGPESPHGNAGVDLALKQLAQRSFEEKHGHDKWMQEFAKNYLTEEEEDGGDEKRR